MKPIRIFRHIRYEGPGYFVEVLEHRHIPYEVICIDAGEAVPPRLDDVSGLVFMGGSMSVNDDLPWIADELALIRRAVAAGVPVLGHCLGGQLISRALGGVVHTNRAKEIGWLDVEKVQSPLTQQWFGHCPDTFEVFHWHGETFSIPPGATLLLQSRLCAHQAFAIGNALALQCHVEMTPEMVEDWVRHYEQGPREIGEGVQSPTEMRTQLTQRARHLNTVADGIYARWLAPIVGAAMA